MKFSRNFLKKETRWEEECPKTSDLQNEPSIGMVVLQGGGVSWEIVQDGARLGKQSLSTLTFVSIAGSAGWNSCHAILEDRVKRPTRGTLVSSEKSGELASVEMHRSLFSIKQWFLKC